MFGLNPLASVEHSIQSALPVPGFYAMPNTARTDRPNEPRTTFLRSQMRRSQPAPPSAQPPPPRASTPSSYFCPGGMECICCQCARCSLCTDGFCAHHPLRDMDRRDWQTGAPLQNIEYERNVIHYHQHHLPQPFAGQAPPVSYRPITSLQPVVTMEPMPTSSTTTITRERFVVRERRGR